MNWSLWAPVMAGYGSLLDVKYKWSLDDLLDSLEAIEIKEQMEEHLRKEMERK